MADNIVPTEIRKLRACLNCALIKTIAQFKATGCENCEALLEMKGSIDRVMECTSPSFDGVAASMAPTDSWVAKWLRVEKLIKGVYALKVYGRLPEDVESLLYSKGITYVPLEELIPMLLGKCFRRFASHASSGSTQNSGDSPGQRLGIKIYPNKWANANNIIFRQRGTPFYPAGNVILGRDHTLNAKVSGIVKYFKHYDKGRVYVSVVPPPGPPKRAFFYEDITHVMKSQ